MHQHKDHLCPAHALRLVLLLLARGVCQTRRGGRRLQVLQGGLHGAVLGIGERARGPQRQVLHQELQIRHGGLLCGGVHLLQLRCSSAAKQAALLQLRHAARDGGIH